MQKKACHKERCCCCGVKRCVLVIGVLLSISVPLTMLFFLMDLRKSIQTNFKQIGRILFIVCNSIATLGFYAGYCGKRAWGRWTMFYGGLAWLLSAIVFLLVLLVGGPATMQEQMDKTNTSEVSKEDLIIWYWIMVIGGLALMLVVQG